MEVDEVGFNHALNIQKERSRAATSLSTEDWVILQDDDKEEFIGYDDLEAKVHIVKYRKVNQNTKEFFQLVFNFTPFYPEGGGQVGDTGKLISDEEEVVVFDTKKENNLIVHLAKKLPENLNAKFLAKVHTEKRALTTFNHSATHLLHHALRSVLGTHVEQKGSLVNSANLRFDFSHFSKVTDEELQQVEQLVSAAIRTNLPLDEHRAVPMMKAQEMGAMALFGEKYGDVVRVIKFGDSVELCGGTHVSATGEIGLFKIITETAVASGVRRIEAISNVTAENFVNTQLGLLDEVKLLLKNPKDLPKAIRDLQEKNTSLSKEIEGFEKLKAQGVKNELKAKIKDVNGINFLGEIVELDGGAIKDILFQLKGEVDNLFAVIGGKSDEKCTLSIIVNEAISKDNDIHAGNLIREASKLIQGGGGGQPFFATAGGKKPEGLQEAIDWVKSKL